MDAELLYQKLLNHLWERLQGEPTLQIAGLAIGGAWIAKRLAKDLSLPEHGVINVAFHRDDYAEKGLAAIRSADTMATHLPFEVTGAQIVLIDDVLFTGRTVRAALNELFDFGRPAAVELMVLADRGRRELPIAADFVGEHIQLPDTQILALEKVTKGNHELFASFSRSAHDHSNKFRRRAYPFADARGYAQRANHPHFGYC